jgi:hypothetical protein
MKRAFLLFLAVVLSLSCGRAADYGIPVRFLDLLSHPEDLDGKLICVCGYVHIKFEDDNLYFTKEHADYLDSEYCIQLIYGPDQKGIEFMPPLPKTKHATQLKDFDCGRVAIHGIFRIKSKEVPVPHIIITAIQQHTPFFDGKRHLTPLSLNVEPGTPHQRLSARVVENANND